MRKAFSICKKSAFLFVSLALPCTSCSLGTKAAVNIPMMTITISISINVKLFFDQASFIDDYIRKQSHLGVGMCVTITNIYGC